MQRRFALSAALGLSVVVLFGLIAVGRSNGMFGGARASTGTEATSSVDDTAAALLYLAAIAPPQAPSPVVEYVYIDAPPEPPIVTYIASTQPSEQAARVAVPGSRVESVGADESSAPELTPTDVASRPTVQPRDDDDSGERDEDDEHGDDGEHEEEDD